MKKRPGLHVFGMFVDPDSQSVFVELRCPFCKAFSPCEVDYEKQQKDLFRCPNCNKQYQLLCVNMKPMLAIVKEQDNGQM